MLFYFKCQKCQNTSGLFLESELPGTAPSCDVCAKTGASQTLVFAKDTTSNKVFDTEAPVA
jgi:transposase-like protein